MLRFRLVAGLVTTIALTACSASSSTSETTVAPTTPTTPATSPASTAIEPTTVPSTEPSTQAGTTDLPEPDAIETPVTPNADGSFTLESVGLTFTLPEGFVMVGEAFEGGFAATRDEPDSAELQVFPCPDCTPDEMDDGETTLTDVTIDGYPAVIGETSVEGAPTKGVLILADGQLSGAIMVGDNIDESWQEFVDSIKITPL